MFEVEIFDPVVVQSKVIHTISDCAEHEAVIAAERFLFTQGIKLANLVRKDTQKRQTIFGFPDQDSIAVGNGGYKCINNSVYFVFKYIRAEFGLKIDSFLDLGCGVGNILIAARSVFGAARLTGIEIDPLLIEQAKKNTHGLGAEITLADMLEWRPAVNDFDMVYTYEPFSDEKLRQRFLSNLKGWLKDGQYVFYQHTNGQLPEWLDAKEIPNVHPCLFTFDKSKA